MSLVVDVLAGAVRGGTSVMYAGLGETVSERAGVINLGTEGCMLVGALGGFAAAYESGNPWVGVLAGAASGGLLALVHAVLCVSRRANQFASGLNVLFLGLGLTSLFGTDYVGKQINALNPVPIPLLSQIPVLGPVLFTQDPLTSLSFATWQPLRVMAGAYLFGAALALSPELQAGGVGINQFALDVLPFVLTLLVLAFLGRRTLLSLPGLARPAADPPSGRGAGRVDYLTHFADCQAAGGGNRFGVPSSVPGLGGCGRRCAEIGTSAARSGPERGARGTGGVNGAVAAVQRVGRRARR